MAKRSVQVYMDTDLIELARAKGIDNLSQFFSGVLEAHLMMSEELKSAHPQEIIDKLHAKLGLMTNEIKKKTDENEELIKEIIELKQKNEELKEKNGSKTINIPIE